MSFSRSKPICLPFPAIDWLIFITLSLNFSVFSIFYWPQNDQPVPLSFMCSSLPSYQIQGLLPSGQIIHTSLYTQLYHSLDGHHLDSSIFNSEFINFFTFLWIVMVFSYVLYAWIIFPIQIVSFLWAGILSSNSLVCLV